MGCCFQNLGCLAEWQSLLIAYLKLKQLKQRPIPLSVSCCCHWGLLPAWCLLCEGTRGMRSQWKHHSPARQGHEIVRLGLIRLQLKYACWSMTWRYLQHLGSEARWHMHFCTWGHVAFFFVLADFCSFQKWPLKESLREYFQEYNWFFTFF